MVHIFRNAALLLLLGILLSACGEGQSEATTYVCPPCAPHDTLRFEHDGECPVCGMKLTEKPDSSHIGPGHIHEGSGNFMMRGGPGHREALIPIYYHRPESFTQESPILIVVPGAGRDGWDYRDAWVEASEQYGILVLTPRYVDEEYGFGDYHMGGVAEFTNIEEVADFIEGSHEVMLDEDELTFEVNAQRQEWLFGDFDRLFEAVTSAVDSERTSYDIFGHSAGGQILHRFVLFQPTSKAERIVAANAGFYTLPDLDADPPFGLDGAPIQKADLTASLEQDLTLLLGEEDDHSEAGGTFLRSPSADVQGPGRLQRGRHFYETGKKTAEVLGAKFAWQVEVVPDVGHDGDGMSKAAAEILYGNGGSD
jgi:pimeloyl-ACP methyl ester carboxylesterase